jgi:hypothetical protein
MNVPGGNFIFKLEVHEGRNFGSTPQAIVCSATFAGETKYTTYSVGGDLHAWNSTLQWVVTKQQLRKLSSLGSNSCKVQCLRKDGSNLDKLGWVVLDTRSAKLQHRYKQTEGVSSVFLGGGIRTKL